LESESSDDNEEVAKLITDDDASVAAAKVEAALQFTDADLGKREMLLFANVQTCRVRKIS
jgi:hypothetical protein